MSGPTDKVLSEQKWSAERKGVLYQEFIRLLRASPVTLRKVAEASGVTIDSMKLWGVRTDARVNNLEAALNVIGYKLAIVPIKDDP